MKLDKKELAARALGVGKGRVLFNKERLAEINEAITKQDIRDLFKGGAIFVKDVSGRKTKLRRKQRRRQGSFKKKVSPGKREYVLLVRSARRAISHERNQGTLTSEQARTVRREIKTRRIMTKAALRERLREVRN